MAEMPKVWTMLMFEGRAEEAMNFYTDLFDDSGVDFMQKYGPDFPGPEGLVVHAIFHVKGQTLGAMDNASGKPSSFTPATSFYVTCENEAEIERLYAALMSGGSALMELGNYPFASKYAWVQDQFGVSWQLYVR